MTIECKTCEAEFTVEVETDSLEGNEICYCPFCGELIEDHGIDDDDGEEDDD